MFDAISFVLGLLYLFLEFKASIWLWPVGIIMPIVHSVTYYKAGLYADFGMEFFYVIVAVYGFLKWRMGKGADTALSIIAYWALANKWAEQWLLWLAVDLVCTVLYIHKGIPFSATLYGFYTIMAVLGYRKWIRLMEAQK